MSDLCKGREGTAANHCWHGKGVILPSLPALTVEICCFCGAERYTSGHKALSGNHGKYLPLGDQFRE